MEKYLPWKEETGKSGVPRIMINTLRNKAENSTSKLESVHAEKLSGLLQKLQELRTTLPDMDKIRFGLNDSALQKG